LKKLIFWLLVITCLIPFHAAFGYLITSPADPALVGIPGINFDDQALGQCTSLTIGNVTFTPSLSATAEGVRNSGGPYAD
jgi:hypothetical protein